MGVLTLIVLTPLSSLKEKIEQKKRERKREKRKKKKKKKKKRRSDSVFGGLWKEY
jgi:hypothetical protein